MQLLLTDETNLQPSPDAKFFIFGGLIIPVDRVVELDSGIREIRARSGYRPGDELKFETHCRPPHVTIPQAADAKRGVIDLCLRLDLKFIVNIILHEIVRNQEQDQRVLSAADYVIGRFNYYCTTIEDHGLCVVDNLPVQLQFRYLSERFTAGLDIQGERRVPLERVLMYAASCVNASHIHSAIDIVLGGFRYCVNNPRNEELARSMIIKLVKLMWHRYLLETDTYDLHGRGLIVRPPREEVRVPRFREEYDGLMAHLNELLREGDREPA